MEEAGATQLRPLRNPAGFGLVEFADQLEDLRYVILA